MAFTEVFRLHAKHQPLKPAIVFHGQTVSFGALDRCINGACFALKKHGVTRGDLVGVALNDTGEHLIMMLALARVGAVMVPIDPRWTLREKQSIVSHFKADRVLVEADEELPDAAWLCPGSSWYAETDEVYFDPEITLETPLLLSLSSGTTGMPKGPRITHRQFESRFMIYWINLGMTAQDIYVCATPLYFGGGRGFTLAMLYAGATIHLFPPPFRPAELIAYVREIRATIMFLVPTMMRRLLQEEFEGLAFPSLRNLISSGSVSYLEERKDFRRRLSPHLYELYSSTEGGSVSMLSPDEFELKPGSVGRPVFRVEVEIVDGEHKALPVGEIGRVRYRSPASSREYFVGDSSEAFHEGWFYPGDLGTFDADGFLHLRGRSKDMIIRGGVNIYPGDIEAVLLAIDGVSEAGVVGAPAADLGEEVVAFVAGAPSLDEAALIAQCKAQLAVYKVPKRIHIIDALPKTAVGKVDKAELKKRLEP